MNSGDPRYAIRVRKRIREVSTSGEDMLWEVTNHLPTRGDFLAMLKTARANTATALAEARRSGNHVLLLQYELQLADWDRLIERAQTSLLLSAEPGPGRGRRPSPG